MTAANNDHIELHGGGLANYARSRKQGLEFRAGGDDQQMIIC
jgi:hypothetical protein